jgi:uncharacterized protein
MNMSKGKSNTIHEAVMRSDLSAIRAAVEAGFAIDELDREGRTPLFYAAQGGKLEILGELIKHHANVNAQDRNLETPLHFAARAYQISAADRLLRHGATVDAQDQNGNTPLSTAVFASRGRGEMIKLLLAHSASKSLKNKHGISPEDLACSIGNYNVKRFLEP